MSHMAVLVVGEDIEEILAPFSEQDESLFKFQERHEEFLKDYAKYAEKEWTYAQFAEDYGYSLDPGGSGKYGYMSNPNAQWDWYTIGGRYADRLVVKPGCQMPLTSRSQWADPRKVPNIDVPPNRIGDTALVEDLDFEAMKEIRAQWAREGWADYLKNKVKYPQDQDAWAREIAGVAPGVRSLEEAVEHAKTRYLSAWAVVHEGVWSEIGSMGWWGMTSDMKDEAEWTRQVTKLVESLPPGTRITYVDCHT